MGEIPNPASPMLAGTAPLSPGRCGLECLMLLHGNPSSCTKRFQMRSSNPQPEEGRQETVEKTKATPAILRVLLFEESTLQFAIHVSFN